ncbi:basic salivary proline-rich protein 4-like [Chamaea fasciata]|uniref:basic salivary proline-rich protein 4-like n=1 Tax=Chamaea fasciata TaxID=190680 RepID=UPI00336A676A
MVCPSAMCVCRRTWARGVLCAPRLPGAPAVPGGDRGGAEPQAAAAGGLAERTRSPGSRRPVPAGAGSRVETASARAAGRDAPGWQIPRGRKAPHPCRGPRPSPPTAPAPSRLLFGRGLCVLCVAECRGRGASPAARYFQSCTRRKAPYQDKSPRRRHPPAPASPTPGAVGGAGSADGRIYRAGGLADRFNPWRPLCGRRQRVRCPAPQTARLRRRKEHSARSASPSPRRPRPRPGRRARPLRSPPPAPGRPPQRGEAVRGPGPGGQPGLAAAGRPPPPAGAGWSRRLGRRKERRGGAGGAAGSGPDPAPCGGRPSHERGPRRRPRAAGRPPAARGAAPRRPGGLSRPTLSRCAAAEVSAPPGPGSRRPIVPPRGGAGAPRRPRTDPLPRAAGPASGLSSGRRGGREPPAVPETPG